jgi:hypothetical protein
MDVAAWSVFLGGPFVQDLAAVAHRCVEARVGGGDVTIEGHADLEAQGAHDVPSFGWMVRV